MHIQHFCWKLNPKQTFLSDLGFSSENFSAYQKLWELFHAHPLVKVCQINVVITMHTLSNFPDCQLF